MQHTFASLFELVEYGQYREALSALTEASLVGNEREGLRHLIEVEISDSEAAYRAVLKLLNRKLNDRERLMCLLVAGRASAIAGRTEEACNYLRQAVSVARSCGDLVLVARSQARLTKMLLRYVGTEAATAEIPNLRKCALLAGDRHAVADFHCVIAEIEIKRRNYGRAQKHLQFAESLCADCSDFAMQGQIGRLTAKLALWASEPSNALKAIMPAVKIFERTGSKYSLIASLSTIAEHHLMVGKFHEAEAVLTRIGQLNDSREARLNNLDSLMVAALGKDDVPKAQKLLSVIETLGEFPSELYSWLWHVTTRARLMIRTDQSEAANSLLTGYRALALKTSDERLVARYLLLEAESIVNPDAPVNAAAKLASSVTQMPRPTLEDFIETNLIAARITSSDNSRSFAERAERIRSIAFSDQPRSYPVKIRSESHVGQLQLLQSVAALFWSSAHAELLAHETAALLQACNVGESVVIAKGRPSGDFGSECNPENSVDICMHDRSGLEYVVRTRAKQDPDAWLSLMAIRSLVRAAEDLAEGRLLDRIEPSIGSDALAEDQSGMIVAAASMSELLSVTRRVATSNVIVLFTGETGTGKELLARALHDASPRRDKPFVPFNCTAVPRDMLDSQLFGYRRGAFTGAQDAFQGVIRAAAGGTIFLDEIGELPLDVQPKLLRFLESGEIHPLGEALPSVVDVRVVAATNADLDKLVEEGRFRKDLYYRLNVVRLPVPSLRERREEIPLIAQHYIDRFSREAQKTGLRLAEETMEYLVLYKWPGNVRQLANEIRRMVALAEAGAVLMPEHLSHEIAASRRTIPASERELASTEVVVRMDQPLSAGIEHVERAMIQYAMTIAEGRQEDAAQLLGLSRKGLYLKRARLKMTAATDEYEPQEEEKVPQG